MLSTDCIRPNMKSIASLITRNTLIIWYVPTNGGYCECTCPPLSPRMLSWERLISQHHESAKNNDCCRSGPWSHSIQTGAWTLVLRINWCILKIRNRVDCSTPCIIITIARFATLALSTFREKHHRLRSLRLRGLAWVRLVCLWLSGLHREERNNIQGK